MQTKVECCDYCSKPLKVDSFYLIYKLVIATNINLRFIGLQTLIEELNVYIMKRGSHLSASQIILLRPDILKEFLIQKLAPEVPIYFFLDGSSVCYKCFESYKDLVPER